MTQDGGREAKMSSGERHRWGRSPRAGSTGPLLPCYREPLSLVVTCVQCREEVLEADQIGDEEECLLRDHLLAVHPNTMQPETPGCCSGPSSSPSSRRRQRRSSAGGEGGRARRPCDGGLTQDPEQAHQPP